MQVPKHILPVIVIAQFCCTSLWFAGNSIIDDLIQNFNLSVDALGHVVSSVQFGFIAGTLVFAILSIADRYSPSKVFMFCAGLGALSNLVIIFGDHNIWSLVAIRFATGFFLAGIYPVGMKIAADYFNKGLGKSLGYLVGALVLGTAFPHFIKSMGSNLEWQTIIMTTSILAVAGGLFVYFLVPDGPYRRSASKVDFKVIGQIFKVPNFRSAAMGYFGHMWELYAFWTFIPLIISYYNSVYDSEIDVPLYSFLIIGVGSLSCIAGGYLSERHGARKVAMYALFISGICCLLSPFIFSLSPLLFLGFLLIWGISVIMDSPMLSTMVAQNADSETKGTALTIVNCIGFSITIISIQLINYLCLFMDIKNVLILLAIGPALGWISLRRMKVSLMDQ